MTEPRTSKSPTYRVRISNSGTRAPRNFGLPEPTRHLASLGILSEIPNLYFYTPRYSRLTRPILQCKGESDAHYLENQARRIIRKFRGSASPPANGTTPLPGSGNTIPSAYKVCTNEREEGEKVPSRAINWSRPEQGWRPEFA